MFDKKPKKKKSRGGSNPTTTMADKQIIPPHHDLDAKWDACLDLTVRRFVYSSAAGAFAGLLFFSQYRISLIHFFSKYAECYGFLENRDESTTFICLHILLSFLLDT